MATAYVSYHPVAMRYPIGSSSLGPAVYSEVLDFTSAQATTSSGLTSALAALSKVSSNTEFVALITTDTDAYVTIGSTPDCTAQTATTDTTARVFVASCVPLEQFIPVGAKVAAKAVA